MAAKYQIMSIPMQMFFAGGGKVDEILGAVPEQMIRAKVDEVLQRFPADERGGLKVVLSSWVEHNKQDSEKFRRWNEKAEDVKNDPAYNSILQAAKEMEEINKRLSQLLVEI
ncbi:hypothetical protein C5S32_00420 [ANME-1 cluster archaeon GoMg1]|nr:hypothetical protein [ANME-1 cluster archaeon GoMg1]